MQPSEIDLWLKGLALAAAGAFFVWKLMTGWLFINLKVGLKLDRVRKDPHIDYLGITLSLEKGPTDSVWLKHIEARVICAIAPKEQRIDMSSETRRLHVHAKRLVWDQVESAGRSIALSPGEATTIARFAEVPAQHPVHVEVLIFGDRTLWRHRGFQWRASAVSLPTPNPQSAQ